MLSNCSGLVSEQQSQVTELAECSALQPTQAFLQSQREMFVKAKFKCDLSKKTTTNKKETENNTNSNSMWK